MVHATPGEFERSCFDQLSCGVVVTALDARVKSCTMETTLINLARADTPLIDDEGGPNA